MRKILLSVALASVAMMPALADAVTPPPTVDYCQDYKGNSFVAKWTGSGSGEYLLTVFSEAESKVKVNEDFSKVNQSNGKLDSSNPGLPSGWTTNLAERGTTDVVYYNGKNHIVLDADGEYLTTPLAEGGNVVNYILNANLVNVSGEITEDNSSVFVVKVYDKQGDLITSGRTYALYFAQRQDFDLAEAFQYNPANIGRVEISLEKNDANVNGDLSINSISYEYAAPSYVMTDKAVSEQSYTVEGLNPENVYYYYVKAIPKALVATSERSIKKINGGTSREDKKQERVVNFSAPLFQGAVPPKSEKKKPDPSENETVIEKVNLDNVDLEKKLEESLKDL